MGDEESVTASTRAPRASRTSVALPRGVVTAAAAACALLLIVSTATGAAGTQAADVGPAVAVGPRVATNTCPTPAAHTLLAPPARGAASRRTVALTIDDGPSTFTPAVLRVLRRERVHATFFVTGRHVVRFPGYVRAEVAAGHVVGNHTWSHPQAVRGSSPYGSFDQLPPTVQAAQVDRTTRAIIDATGLTPCFFRAPGGHGTASVALVAAHGLSTIGWNRSSGDSNQPARTRPATVRRLVAAATAHPGPHVTLLTHDAKASAEPDRVVSANRSNSVAALPDIIAWYRAHGYQFVQPDGAPFPRPPVFRPAARDTRRS